MELRDIPGFGGHYVVSQDGDIYRVLKKGYRLIHPKVTRCSYIYAQLHVDGKKKGIMVHRAVALAYLPNPDNLPEVNHKDEDKTNNSVDNLEWCTREYNLNYGSYPMKRSIIAKALWKTEGYREKQTAVDRSGIMTEMWKDEGYAQRQHDGRWGQ